MSKVKKIVKIITPKFVRSGFTISMYRLKQYRIKRKKALLFRRATSKNWIFKKLIALIYNQSNYVFLLGINDLEKRYAEKIINKNSFDTNLLCSELRMFENKQIIKDNLIVTSSTSYTLTLSDVTVFGESNLILVDDNHALYDLKNIKNDNIAFTDKIFFSERDEIYLYVNSKQIVEIDEAINLLVNYSFNYYHFVYEVLVKFQYLNGISTKVPLLVDEIVERTPQFKELLDLFNKEKRKVIFIKKQNKIQVKTLHHIGLINIIPSNFKDNSKIVFSDVQFERDSLKFVRENLVNCLKGESIDKKIYLSRKGASERRKFNEVEISDVLLERGFEIVIPQEHSVMKQIDIFNNANIIIGGSGAAFTNLIFCNENARVFILIKNTFNLSIFSTIAEFVGCDLQYIIEEKKETLIQNEDLHDSFVIDSQQVLRAIA